MKIKIWDGAIIIPVEINRKTKNLMFDTGAEMGFWIGEEEDWMTPSGNTITFVDSQKTRQKKAVMKLPPIKMGNITFTDVWVSTDNRTGKVGSAILKKNSLIIDGHKRRLVLLPHDGNTVQYYGNEDKRGIKFIHADKNDTLGAMKAVVRKSGDAYRKGIRTGDYLISVNGVEITDYCTYFKLKESEKLKYCVFRSPEGEIKEMDW